MSYEEARVIIRQTLAGTFTADGLSKENFIELEDALTLKAYDIYRAVEREFHKQDVLNYFDENKQPSEDALEEITDRYEDYLDDNTNWSVALDEAVNDYENTSAVVVKLKGDKQCITHI